MSGINDVMSALGDSSIKHRRLGFSKHIHHRYSYSKGGKYVILDGLIPRWLPDGLHHVALEG